MWQRRSWGIKDTQLVPCRPGCPICMVQNSAGSPRGLGPTRADPAPGVPCHLQPAKPWRCRHDTGCGTQIMCQALCMAGQAACGLAEGQPEWILGQTAKCDMSPGPRVAAQVMPGTP